MFGFMFFVGEYRKPNAGMGVLGAPFVLGFFFVAGAVSVLAGILLTRRMLRGETLAFWFATALLAFPAAMFGLALPFFMVHYPVIAVVTVPWFAMLTCGFYRAAKASW